MLTTAQCTIYHYVGNNYTRYTAQCHWQDTQADTVSKTGQINTGSVAVYVPLTISKLPTLYPTKDLIIKGVVDFDFDATTEAELSVQLKNLKAKYNVKTIMSVDIRGYGSTLIAHYKITAK